MCWLKREMWKAGIALAGVLLLLGLLVWIPPLAATDERTSGRATQGTGQATPTVDPTMTALQKEQLTQQVRQLDNWWLYWFYNGSTACIAAFACVGVALFGLSQWRGNRNVERKKEQEAQDKELEDRKAERDKREEEQKRWLEDRKAEREKRAEERFQKVVEGLGDERTEVKVGAAITLRTFLQPGYERFYRQAFDLAVAHLRLRKAEASAPGPLSSPAPVLIIPEGSLRQEQQPPSPPASIPLDSLSQALITVFKESFPRARQEWKKTTAQFKPQQLDATNVRLDHAHLVDADLAQAWLRRASLREVDLSHAQLKGADLVEAQLEGADLSWAELEGAKLWGAQLKGAKLRGVQLKGADLREAQLEEADLREAQLKGADLVEAQLKGADLRWTQLKGAKLWGAQLEGADLNLAQLEGADLVEAQLKGAKLWGAQLEGALLSRAQLEEADLTWANPEAAASLEYTNMKGIIGLTPEQREACIKKGAIFDDVQQAPTSATSSSSSPAAQSNEAQAPLSPLAQEYSA